MSLYFWIIWCDSLRHLVTLRPFIDILVRSECYKPQDTHLSPSVTIQAASGWCSLKYLSRISFIDQDWLCVVLLLCDNDQVSFMILIIVTILTPSPERLLIGHMCIMKASDWWSRSHLLSRTCHATRSSHDTTLSVTIRNQKRIFARDIVNIDKTLLWLETLCSYLCTSPMMVMVSFFIRLKYDDAPLQNRSRNCLIFL